MRRPFDVELFAKVERQHRLFFQFDLRLAAVQLLSTFRECGGIDGVDAEQQLRRGEIRIRFLRRRIEIHEDDFVRIVTTDDRAPRELEERVARQPGEPARPLAIEPVHLLQRLVPRVALHDLQ